MAREKSERQVFAITVAVIGAGILAIGALTLLSYNQLRKLDDEAASLRTQISQHRQVSARREAVEEEKAACEARFEDARKYLPSEKEVDLLLKDLDRVCKESRLRTHEIKQERSAEPPGRRGAKPSQYEAIGYKGDFRGSFHDLARFVSRVEDWTLFNRFVNIVSFEMKAAEKGLCSDKDSPEHPAGSKQEHTVKMTLEFYKYQPPAAGPATGVAGAPGAPGAAAARPGG